MTKDKNFTQISNEILNNNKISSCAYKLYSYFQSKKDLDYWIFHNEEIYSHFKESEKTIFRAKTELKNLNLIQIKQLKDKNGHFDGFIVKFLPENTDNSPCGKKPYTASRLSENGYTENGYTENRLSVDRYTENYSYNNTDINNTDINNTDINNTDNKKEKEKEKILEKVEDKNLQEVLKKLNKNLTINNKFKK